MDRQLRTAAERRAAIKANADNLGINDDYISLLVDRFYEKIRRDDRIGPIFKNKIGNEWELHLSKMKDFWASVAFNAGRYSGKPVPKHQALTTTRPEHFEIWLTLFEETLIETAPTPDVVPYFMKRASLIAQSLQLAMFGVPDIPGNRW